MEHYGKKEITFKQEGNNDILGLTFQVTDVRKPLLAVRRLVEKGESSGAGGRRRGELHPERGVPDQGPDQEARLVVCDRGPARQETDGLREAGVGSSRTPQSVVSPREIREVDGERERERERER